MTRHQFLAALVCVVLSACNRPAPIPETRATVETAARPEDSPPAATLGDYLVADPIQPAGLTIGPLRFKTPGLEDPFITLDEDVRAGTVEMREIGAGIRNARGQSAPRTADRSDSEEPAGADEDAAGDVLDASEPCIGDHDVNWLTVININRDGKHLDLMTREIIVVDSKVGDGVAVEAAGDIPFLGLVLDDPRTEFDNLVFGGGLTMVDFLGETYVDAARRRLGLVLKERVAEFAADVEISAAQARKLELAGRGDIERLLARIADCRRRFGLGAEDEGLRAEAVVLQALVVSGPFDDQSLLSKTLHTVLDKEQIARLELRRAVRSIGRSYSERFLPPDRRPDASPARKRD